MVHLVSDPSTRTHTQDVSDYGLLNTRLKLGKNKMLKQANSEMRQHKISSADLPPHEYMHYKYIQSCRFESEGNQKVVVQFSTKKKKKN